MGTQQRRPAISLSVAALLAACGYQSAYVPKADRFGVVWRDNELVMVPPQTSSMCSPAGQWVETKNLAQGSTQNARRLAMIATHNRRVDERSRRTEDHDDDDDVGLEGPAATIAAVVVVATALTGAALGLALAPAGKPQHNAAVLRARQRHNNALRLLEEECMSTAKAATPPQPPPTSNFDPLLNAVTPSTSMILESGSEKETPTDVLQEGRRWFVSQP